MGTLALHPDIQEIENAGANTSASGGTAVVAGGSNHTKGSYTQLTAATTIQGRGLFVMMTNGVGDYLVDIAIGGAGSEQVIAANLLYSLTALALECVYFIPIEVPLGARISARAQSQSASNSLRVSCLVLGGGMAQSEGWGGFETMGVDTLTTRGTSIDPGGTLNTKGSWVQMTSACGHELRGLVIAIGHQLNTVRSTANWLLDVGIGGAGSEQVIVPNVAFRCTTASDMILPNVYPFIGTHIPAGSRIAVRVQCDINDASDRLFDVALYGAY